MATKKEIEYVINETFGPEALPIALYLINKENISEFVIAKDLSIEIHRIRKIFYKLLEDNIVVFTRKKDKIKGWYICYWSLNTPEIPYIAKKIKKAKVEKLKERLDQETTDDFYMCRNACTRMNFDNAFELNFKCPDCGEIMNQQDNQRTKEFLAKRIAKLEKEIEANILSRKPKQKKEPAEDPKTKDKSFGHSTKLNKPKKVKPKKTTKGKPFEHSTKLNKPVKKVEKTKAKKKKVKKVVKAKKPTKPKKAKPAKKVEKPKAKKKFSLFRKKKK